MAEVKIFMNLVSKEFTKPCLWSGGDKHFYSLPESEYNIYF